jgi:hypothetical protein
MNGLSKGKLSFQIVICLSAIASSKADWTFEGALFISSARIKLLKIGHFFTSKLFVFEL